MRSAGKCTRIHDQCRMYDNSRVACCSQSYWCSRGGYSACLKKPPQVCKVWRAICRGSCVQLFGQLQVLRVRILEQRRVFAHLQAPRNWHGHEAIANTTGTYTSNPSQLGHEDNKIKGQGDLSARLWHYDFSLETQVSLLRGMCMLLND